MRARGGNAFISIPFVILFVLIAVYLHIAPLYERIVVGLAFLSFAIPLFSLIARFSENNIVKVNVKKFGICVEKGEYPLLKALIKMKAKHQEINLEQIYNQNPSMFEREKLLERLYN